MRPPVVARFGFRIRTRKGIVVDVILPGRDASDAERKLHQIYRECEVLQRYDGSAAGLPEGTGDSSAAG